LPGKTDSGFRLIHKKQILIPIWSSIIMNVK